MAILAKDIGRKILETLRESAREALPDVTEAEREESIAKFLGIMSDAMFAGPAKKVAQKQHLKSGRPKTRHCV
jgi:hypothetical protein